jgi:hypothetical protein
LHVLFGWLEIDEMLPIVERRAECLERHPWAADHPHFANPAHYTDMRNTLYIAPPCSAYVTGRSGGGMFSAVFQCTAIDGSRDESKCLEVAEVVFPCARSNAIELSLEPIALE